MELSLPPDLTDYVAAKLASGQFATVDELAIAALRHARNAEARELEALRRSIDEARASAARGEGTDLNTPEEIEAFFNEICREAEERVAAQKGASCAE